MQVVVVQDKDIVVDERQELSTTKANQKNLLVREPSERHVISESGDVQFWL